VWVASLKILQLLRQSFTVGHEQAGICNAALPSFPRSQLELFGSARAVSVMPWWNVSEVGGSDWVFKELCDLESVQRSAHNAVNAAQEWGARTAGKYVVSLYSVPEWAVSPFQWVSRPSAAFTDDNIAGDSNFGVVTRMVGIYGDGSISLMADVNVLSLVWSGPLLVGGVVNGRIPAPYGGWPAIGARWVA
jgi:hypothetical protein